jgi:hypothetical protein
MGMRPSALQIQETACGPLRAGIQGTKYTPPSLPLPRKHLSIRRFTWWARFIAINTFLFFLFFFLTTPAIIINTIDMYNVTRPIEKLQVPPLLRPGLGAPGRSRKNSGEDGMGVHWVGLQSP